MNKIFKTLKNRRTGASTAVSELQTGHTKGSGAKATVVAAAVLAALAAGTVAAQSWTAGADVSLTQSHWPDRGTTHVGSGFAFGNQNLDYAAKTYGENIDVSAGVYTLYFEGFDATGHPTVELDVNGSDTLSLFKQSQGFEQALIHAHDIDVGPLAFFKVDTKNSHGENIFEQSLVQNGARKAQALYVVGGLAAGLTHADDGSYVFEDHTWDGIRVDSTTIYTASVLAGLDLVEGQRLDLSVEGAQAFGARLSGAGGIGFTGTDRNTDSVTIDTLFEHQSNTAEWFEGANDYTGGTWATNVTLNLERKTSLGSSGILNATNANIVELNEGALGKLTRLELTDTNLTAYGNELTVGGNASFAGENTFAGAKTVSIEGTAALVNGSLTTDAALDANSLDLSNGALTAASVTVNVTTRVSGESSVTTDLLQTYGNLTVNSNGKLTVSGDLTTMSSVDLLSGSLLKVRNATINGYLTLKGASVDAQTFTANGSLSISGANTISTVNGASIPYASLIVDNGTSLDVLRGGLSTSLNAVVNSGGVLSVADGLSVGKTLTLQYGEHGTNFSAEFLKVGETLSFVGTANRPDDDYAFATPTSALTEEGTYNVSLKDTNVRYWTDLADVGTTTLDQAHLTLDYVKRGSLGDYVVMTNTSGTETSNNRLTLVSQQGGIMIDNSFKVTQSASEDVIELMGEGQVTFAGDLETNTDYKGWIRMTGTTLSLNDALKKDYAPHMSLSVGTGGTIVFSGNEAITLKRLGWADPGINQTEGVLDLSGFDFSKLGSNDAAITVDNLTVNGNGVIKLDQSAVSGLAVSGGTAGETIFDASENIQGAIKVIATGKPTANSGSIAVKVDGASSSASIVEGYFGANGVYTTDSASAAAKGTWSYGSTFENDGLYVAHTLTGVELLGGKTLSLDVASGETKSLTLSMTGAGNLTKKGAGTLHLSNQENDLSGSVLVQAGTLQADAGALGGIGSGKAGSSSLTVIGSSGTEAKFHLTGGQDGENTQYLKSLQAMGTGIVEIGDVYTDHRLTLALVGPSSNQFNEYSHLYGNEYAVLAVGDNAKLEVKGLANVASDYDGTIYVGETGTLTLTSGYKDNSGNENTVADLSLVSGAGTVVLQDRATYTEKDGFTGTLRVEKKAGAQDGVDTPVGDLTITEAAKTAGATLVMTAGKITSVGEHTFKSISLTGGTINLGSYTAGEDEKASGYLKAEGDVTLGKVTLEVNPDYSGTKVDASNILTFDNEAGQTTKLLEGASLKGDLSLVTVSGISDAEHQSALMQNDTQIGTIDYALTEKHDATSIGVNARAEKINLTGTLELTGTSGMQGENSTLDLLVNGKTSDSTVKVLEGSGSVTLKQANSYGKLVVEQGAGALLDADQTLASGGSINGRVQTGAHNLVVTGGTLEVGKSANGNIGIKLDATGDGKAELLLKDRTGYPNVFEKTVEAGNGALITFDNSRGRFALESGTAVYNLKNGSLIYFNGAAENFAADTVTLDTKSVAEYDFTGKASSADLSKVKGDGVLMLDYATAGGAFDLAGVTNDFTGMIGVRNGTMTIGTDREAVDGELTAFLADRAGKLFVASGSTLALANDKTGAGSGNFTPNPLKLNAGSSLTISDQAVLDFTKGISDGDTFYGNTSGISANALDMNGGRLTVVDNGLNDRIAVKAQIDALDLSSGFDDAETVKKGSILDLIGQQPVRPVLTLITNIGGDEAQLATIADNMRLDLDDPKDVVAEYWQPDWSGEGPAVHVANVHTDVGLMADAANNGIAIGVGITQIDVLEKQTLRIDPSVSVTSGGDNVLSAKITGENASVRVTNDLGASSTTDRVVFAANNAYTGSTVFETGVNAAVTASGAFATSSLVQVDEGAKLELEVDQVQGDEDANAVVMQKLDAKGEIVFANGSDLLLTGANESTVAENAKLEGNADSVLRLEKGAKLSVAELEQQTEFEGSVRLAEGTTLTLTGAGKTDTATAIDLSKVEGAGTIVLGDYAKHDTTGNFEGTTRVAGGYLVIEGAKARATSGANLEMTSGTIESKGEHVFNSITLTGGVLNVGKVQAGDDIASGALHGKTVNLDNVEIQVAVESEPTVDADNILEIDNVEGKDTWLVKGDKVTTGKITITGLENAEKDSDLVQDGKTIGQLHYAVKQNPTDKGVSFNTKADSLTLDGTLKLEGALEPTADTTLDLAVDGNGTINVTSQTVTIAQANEYGALEVDRNATVNLDATQTLTQGGRISGNVNGDAGLNVTGGTLTVNGMDDDGFAVRVGSKATLAFEDLKGSPDIFKGAVTADEGSTVSFSNTTGNFNLASGSARYALTNGSSVTFDRTVADGATFSAGSVSVEKLSDEKVETWSTAIFDITGKAGKVDLSGVSGAGRIVLDYTPSASNGTLDVTKLSQDFTGQLAFTNAQATIGTAETSVLNDFATKQGSLWVGAGSVLSVNNTKVPAEEGGLVTPNPVKLAGDLTVSDFAVLDFTKGINSDPDSDPDSDPGDGYLGNTSGISVNAIDMQNHKLVVADNGSKDLITVRVDLDRIDISSGFPDVDGSILDLMAGTETSPVLTLITGIDATDDKLKSLASDMRLAKDESEDTVVEFWQPGWDQPNGAADKVHVANVHTGVRLVADTENRGIAVGAGITQIDIVSGATLRMDASVSTGGATDVDASITGEDDKVKLLVTNNLGTAPTEGVKFLAENSYTGETVIDLGAKAVAGHASAFASSKVVRVGTMDKDQGGNTPADSTLVLDTAQVKGSAYVNAVKMKAIELGANGNLVIANENDLLLTGAGTSTFADGATVTGGDTTSIGLADGELNIVNLDTFSGFKGDFRVNTGASVNFSVADGQDYTWSHDVLRYTDENARAVGAGEFVKSGKGTLVLGSKAHETTPDLSGMNLVVNEGQAELNNATLLGLTTRTGAVVDVNGIFTTTDLTADKDSIFLLNVETGRAADLKEGESAAKKSIRALDETRSDGIRVTGTASGTLNLAVTPNDVKKGAEESIQLVDAAKAADGFTVNLVDKTGAKVEALTAGAYDYTLVRKDDAANGTDVFLSSLTGDDDIRNTTVTAGSYLGVAAAAQLFDISLHDRMSNRSWLTANADGSIANSFWILETVSNERYGDSTGQIDVHDTASTTTVGSDILSGLAAGGTWYAGAMFSYATEDTKSRSNRTALDSRADTDAWAAGFYAGWQLNGADRTGPYVDGWVLWTDAESDVKGGNVSETVDGNGLSASLEAGWGFKALSYNAHGQAGDIYVEPHVSVTWFGYEADDISNDVHDVTFEGKDNIRTKLGVKTYAFGKHSGGFSPFVELNWIHNTETYGVTMSGVTVDQVGAENQGEVRAGADWRINDAFSVWGHFGITSGSDGYSNREGTFGVRYRF